jgi:hypothetical protein
MTIEDMTTLSPGAQKPVWKEYEVKNAYGLTKLLQSYHLLLIFWFPMLKIWGLLFASPYCDSRFAINACYFTNTFLASKLAQSLNDTWKMQNLAPVAAQRVSSLDLALRPMIDSCHPVTIPRTMSHMGSVAVRL